MFLDVQNPIGAFNLSVLNYNNTFLEINFGLIEAGPNFNLDLSLSCKNKMLDKRFHQGDKVHKSLMTFLLVYKEP